MNCCPVRLVDKYISLCPEVKNKTNFYLQSLSKTTPAQWYSDRVMGINAIRKVVKNLLSSADIDGYFMNHSLRCTSSTRMFQAGIDHKIVKEITGHRSDAIDKYQITSEDQKAIVSIVIECPVFETKADDKDSKVEVTNEENPQENDQMIKDVPIVSTVKMNSYGACSCTKKYDSQHTNWNEMIDAIISAKGPKGKAKIKLEIEFSD